MTRYWPLWVNIGILVGGVLFLTGMGGPWIVIIAAAVFGAFGGAFAAMVMFHMAVDRMFGAFTPTDIKDREEL